MLTQGLRFFVEVARHGFELLVRDELKEGVRTVVDNAFGCSAFLPISAFACLSDTEAISATSSTFVNLPGVRMVVAPIGLVNLGGVDWSMNWHDTDKNLKTER